MDELIPLMTLLVPAGGIGMALAAFAVSRLKRDPGICIERGKPRIVPGDTTLNW